MRLDVTLHNLTVVRLVKYMNSNKIIFNEEYQRSFVWSKNQQKNLIQSILEKAPIGVLIIRSDKQKFEVLDGQQRIKTITKFCNNALVTLNNKKFNQLQKEEKDTINSYKIYYLQLNKNLTEEETSTIFIRLQEGSPLNTAEKVNAFVGKFKTSFIGAFRNNSLFFSKINNNRFRARLLAAQFLVIALETNFDKMIFPNLRYATMKKLNEKYKKNIQNDAIRNYNKYIKFLGNALRTQIEGIKVREWIPIYTLIFYLHNYQLSKNTLDSNLKKFISKFNYNLNSFTIYDEKPPVGIPIDLFETLRTYKNIGRKATSSDSIHGRFEIMLKLYKEMFPLIKFKEPISSSLGEILKSEESNSLELKSSMLWDYNQNKANKDLTKPIIKTIAAYMNSDGGILIVGVSNDKKILGLDNDFQNVGKTKDWDAWQQRLVSLINSEFGKEFNLYVKIDPVKEDGKIIAKISVRKSLIPTYVDPNGNAEFYIRAANTTQLLNNRESNVYIKSHFQ